MFINAAEFESAFSSVQKEYPKISKQLAESFISKLGDAVQENRKRPLPQHFGELLRLALNDSHVWERIDREPYKVLAGKFFGRRGGHASHRGQSKKPVSKKQEPAPVLVIERSNGQLAWKI
ncbi:hypothetical protein A2392_00795 [Candidatus Kaiserbacteria bacterium RIFOXYB1_FULL_46_14]|uniref:Uncharacterized protein n=1 Tax=Candidatus Kaiserbacteria bacterium RIFOXYB1_FULL_46_14 TaxID=1798531 RepID=A0A1F6FJF5_9BACT|nr:MAG: hypothetical protein A2392_00795 [Candidatus Kaiserbacteria bacterium RIFOXYB1_FULL_46_14]